MQYEVLGALRARSDDGILIPIAGARQRRLLSVLVVSRGRPVSSDVLCEHVGVTLGALRVAVSRLRRLIGPDGLVTAPTGYELRAESVDAQRFEQLLDVARQNAPGARDALETALALWRGDPYGDFAHETWARTEVRRLEELHAGATEDLVACLVATSEWSRAIALLDTLIERYPFRDRPRALLMQALADSGRRLEALRTFQDYRTLLDETFGTQPSEAIVALDREIARREHTGAAPRSVAVAHLPVPSTSLVGRAHEVADLLDVVLCNRLVTLTGCGGVGKTRLAVAVAEELAAAFPDDYPDGVTFVDLAAVSDPASVADTVATAAGLTPHPGRSPIEMVAEGLAIRRALIVLDNCEHVLAAAGALVTAILDAAPAVTVLATSREALQLKAECVQVVPTLSFAEGTTSTAVELFVERARRVRAGFSISAPSDAEAVVDICRRVDGIPLAIELAAARLVSMSAAELRDRLADRFRVLSGPPRAHARHQTLRRTVAWSYDLLDLSERSVLLRCAAFAGSFDLAAGAAVCALDGVDEPALLDIMDSLARKSLVTVETVDGSIRYAMLETIRDFAADELAASGAAREVRDRHAHFFADAAVAHFAVWSGRQPRLALDWVDVEFANLRTAFRWAMTNGDLRTASAIAAHTAMMTMPLPHDEPVGWTEEVLAGTASGALAQLPRLLTAATFCGFAGRVDDAIEYARGAQQFEAHRRRDSFAPG